ncbi:putative integral membrane protein [Nostocoides japonicum T1-X7]|uniref:Putative integral membrane protein n=1 Tax=Nostocoides japonicum T1-X7 TaxID=1194083 RepID=A0A077M3N8_9MICO|nr:DUF998 domain-containing protein [Tetrasphaera japonica]CCH80441.1 putative integral membrane protein [Tetrasphaera japonica T1-X7]
MDRPDRPSGLPRTAVASATVAAVALVGGWTWAASRYPGFDVVHDSLSSLSASSTAHRWIMTTAWVVTGLAHVVTALVMPGLRRRARACFALGGVFVVLIAALPIPEPGVNFTPHVLASAGATACLALWPWLAADPDAPWPLRVPVARVATVVMGALGLVLLVSMLGHWYAFGLTERSVALAEVGWPLVTAVGMWWRHRHAHPGPAARHAGAFVALLLACALGGAATTAIWPTTTRTTYYSAELTLSLDPGDSNHLSARTVLGDIDVAFRGLAPGIVARPEVRSDITRLLAQDDVTVDELEPSQEELADAVRHAAIVLGCKFVGGTLLVAVLFVVGYDVVRRRRPTTRLVITAVAGWLVASLGTGIATWATYQPANQSRINATGVLGVVQRNSTLLEDVGVRAEQVTPYLRNLLALSNALQEKYAAGTLDTPAVARLLLVSDIHGGDQYALMRTIVQEERIDAVIDSGDLVNFGRPQELDAARIPQGIASLQVPYFFILGNHDRSSPGDQAVLTRLAKVKNVHLLQPTTDGYTEYSLHGIRIAGFNDPRFFGDSNTNTAARQKPVRDAFVAAMEAAEGDDGNRSVLAPDIVVSHEPAAVRGLSIGGILINGHMHVPDLEGNRIQVGTFTGGGPFSHFLENESKNGEELVGQPSAFDIAVFGGDCRLSALTRYTFRNVVEGRPAYDDVTLINGSRIESTVPGPEGRTCSATDPLTATPFAAVGGDG